MSLYEIHNQSCKRFDPVRPSRKVITSASSLTSATAMAEPTGFCHLPRELRDQIYGYVLPAPSIDTVPADCTLLRMTGGWSTAFMASRRGIYEEAAEFLYKDRVFQAEIHVAGLHAESVLMKFLGRTADLDFIGSSSAFAGLSEIRRLSLQVNALAGNDALCAVQDAMFRFFSHLRKDHNLCHLSVNIVELDLGRNLHLPGQIGYGRTSAMHSHVEEDFATTRVFAETKWNLPPMLNTHCIPAFLADPLKQIKLARDVNTNVIGRFSLRFKGVTAAPYLEVPRRVRDALRGRLKDRNYAPFGRYFDILWPLMNDARALTVSLWREPISHEITAGLRVMVSWLCHARIEADLAELHRAHVGFIAQIEKLQNAVASGMMFMSRRDTAWRVATGIVALGAALPEPFDPRYLGYNQLRASLALYDDDKDGFVAYKRSDELSTAKTSRLGRSSGRKTRKKAARAKRT